MRAKSEESARKKNKGEKGGMRHVPEKNNATTDTAWTRERKAKRLHRPLEKAT